MPEIGSTLREARMRARIDISEIEAQTKIRAKYLRALENEEWGLLPGPTFVKSFLRTYAQALGLDGRALVEEYRLSEEGPADYGHEPIMPAHRPEAGEGSSNGYRFAVGAIVAVIVILLALLILHHKSEPASNSTAQVSLTVHADAPIRICLVNGGGSRVLRYLRLERGQSSPAFRSTNFLLWTSGRDARVEANGVSQRLPAGRGAYAMNVTAHGRTAAADGSRLKACG